MNLKIFVLIVVSFELASAKKYEICEFAKEAFVKYHVPRDEIFRHICIAQPSLDTSSDGTLVGIYQIGKQWWCGEDEPKGGCNLKCSKLLDEDLTDDVECVTKILKQQGLDAWDTNDSECIEEHGQYINSCLAIIDALNVNATAETTAHP